MIKYFIIICSVQFFLTYIHFKYRMLENNNLLLYFFTTPSQKQSLSWLVNQDILYMQIIPQLTETSFILIMLTISLLNKELQTTLLVELYYITQLKI